ncbi:hypothetical protein FACS1894198_2900 [Clostridia bacterium]|nr:hypothetical protein FACS1894198_2900 [Clostridia bacterium]
MQNNGFSKLKNWPLWALLLVVVVVTMHFAIGPKLGVQLAGGSLVRYSYDSKDGNIANTDKKMPKIRKTSDIATGTKGFFVLLPGSKEMKQPIDGLAKEVSRNKIAPAIGQEFWKRYLIATGLAVLTAGPFWACCKYKKSKKQKKSGKDEQKKEQTVKLELI